MFVLILNGSKSAVAVGKSCGGIGDDGGERRRRGMVRLGKSAIFRRFGGTLSTDIIRKIAYPNTPSAPLFWLGHACIADRWRSRDDTLSACLYPQQEPENGPQHHHQYHRAHQRNHQQQWVDWTSIFGRADRSRRQDPQRLEAQQQRRRGRLTCVCSCIYVQFFMGSKLIVEVRRVREGGWVLPRFRSWGCLRIRKIMRGKQTGIALDL